MEQKKEVRKMADDKKGINPAATGLAGAILGAVATAAAIALSDPKNRKKAEAFLKDLKERGEKGLEQLKAEAEKISNKVQKAKEFKQLKSGKKPSSKKR
ncbi:hypothetical protein HYS92_02510 [Candidatus Daviesbacteria bacterium]|nr:hypothetical protein [Candidatus Daviesbacteria bacterium]